jgi:hypothetical protein
MRYFLIIALFAGVIGCDTSPGPDAISSHTIVPGSGGCGCHGAAVGVRRQILGSGGDFASNASVTSHHVAGASDPTSTQCLVCHDLSQHMQGTVRLNNADTGAVIAYSPVSPSSLEPFCLSCHDANGAGGNMSPFADGANMGVVPYVASTTIASSWSGSSTHRNNSLTCAGTGQATIGSGCHGTVSTVTGTSMINMHGSTVKGLLTNTMNFQIQLSSESAYTTNKLVDWNYNNYKLCFDCHAGYPNVTAQVVLGYKLGGVYDLQKAPTPTTLSTTTTTMLSLFRDHYVGADPLRPYSDNPPLFGDTYLALHNYHLIGFEFSAITWTSGINPLQWKYRGDPTKLGRITCTACHNVHGTVSATVRSTYTELNLTRDYYLTYFGMTTQPTDSYTTLDPLPDVTVMGSSPMNCAIACHVDRIYPTSYWYFPNGD